MAEEKIGAAGSAEIADENILGAQAGGEKLRAVGFAEIEVDVFRRRLVAGRFHVEPLERVGLVACAGFVEVVVGIGELGHEFGDEIGGDFVATRANGGADGSEEMRRLAAKFKLHAADCFFGNAGEGAAPTRVNSGDGVFLRIDEKDGEAIGGLDGKEDARAVGGGGITFARVG